MENPVSLGFIGAGHIASAVAKVAVTRGHRVVLSNSRGPESLASLVHKLGPNATAGTVDDATKMDIVVLAVPLHAYQCVPPESVVGKIVIDAINYYPHRDGKFAELDTKSTTSSEMVELHLPGAKVIKAFNTIVYFQFGADGSKRGSRNRRALPIAGNDPAAKGVVADLIDEFGFDSLDVGNLPQSQYFQPIPYGEIAVGFLGSWISQKTLGFVPVYGVPHSAIGLRKALMKNGWKPPIDPIEVNDIEAKDLKVKGHKKHRGKQELNDDDNVEKSDFDEKAGKQEDMENPGDKLEHCLESAKCIQKQT